MTRFNDHSFINVKWADRPEIAHLLIETAAGMGLDHQNPMVLASTSEGFRVRNDVLNASGLQDDTATGGSGEPARTTTQTEPGAGDETGDDADTGGEGGEQAGDQTPAAEPQSDATPPAKTGSSKSTSRTGKR